MGIPYPLLIKLLIDEALPKHNGSLLVKIFILFFVLVIVQLILNFLLSYFSSKMSQNLVASIRYNLYTKSLNSVENEISNDKTQTTIVSVKGGVKM